MNDGIMHSCSSIAGFSLLLCSHILELDHFAIVHGVQFIIQGKKLIYFFYIKNITEINILNSNLPMSLFQLYLILNLKRIKQTSFIIHGIPLNNFINIFFFHWVFVNHVFILIFILM